MRCLWGPDCQLSSLPYGDPPYRLVTPKEAVQIRVFLVQHAPNRNWNDPGASKFWKPASRSAFESVRRGLRQVPSRPRRTSALIGRDHCITIDRRNGSSMLAAEGARLSTCRGTNAPIVTARVQYALMHQNDHVSYGRHLGVSAKHPKPPWLTLSPHFWRWFVAQRISGEPAIKVHPIHPVTGISKQSEPRSSVPVLPVASDKISARPG